jgi:predicted esterase
MDEFFPTHYRPVVARFFFRHPSYLLVLPVIFWLLASSSPAFADDHTREPESLDVQGGSTAYFYAPKRSSGQRPVIVYLHGRGGNPHDDCKKWAQVATEFGWLLCPSGQVAHGNGRSWANSWPTAQHIVDASLEALRKSHGSRVQRFGNILIGFSEGAFAAQNIAVREPRVFNRWLILASTMKYWGQPGLQALEENRRSIRRVYLLTGVLDPVAPESREVYDALRDQHVRTKIDIIQDMGHDVPHARMRELYRPALLWLTR